MDLASLGLDERVVQAFAPWSAKPGVVVGRVAIEFNHILRVYTAEGELNATLSGRLKHEASRRAELPAVGDWVALRRAAGEEGAAILAVLPRRSRFSRRIAGQVTDEQVVAANVDVVYLVMGLDGDFSVRRLERYLLLSGESGAVPVVLLTKPDLAADLPVQVADVVGAAGTAPVHVLNPRERTGLEPVEEHLGRGRTGALLGSSGVGKTTIINRLAGTDVRRTQEVRLSDSKGRHTTVHRELVILPGGALLIDTPGMRELQLWSVGEAAHETFDDIDALAVGLPLRRLPPSRRAPLRRQGRRRRGTPAAGAAGELPQATGGAGVSRAAAGPARAARGEAAVESHRAGPPRASQNQARMRCFFLLGR